MNDTSSSDSSMEEETLVNSVLEYEDGPEDLNDEPAIDLNLEFSEIPQQFPSGTVLQPLGSIFAILLPFLVVKPHSSIAILDIGSLVGIQGSQEVVGFVWEVLGPVKEPLYSVLLRPQFHNAFCKSDLLFFSPSDSKLVSKDHLFLEKGTDVGPNEATEYSDDEEEKQYKSQRTEESGAL